MDPAPDPPPPEPPAPRWLFRCHACGRTTPVGVAEADACVSRGWPRCCGEVMSLQTAGDPSDRPDRDYSI